jgi:hypothetical protein
MPLGRLVLRGLSMKHIATLLALVVTVSIFCAAQTVQPSAAGHPKKMTISGKISDDGKAIVAEGRTWFVSNVEKVRTHVGQNVTVKGLLNPVTNQIEVLSMKMMQAEPSTAVRLGDSAFRR